MAAQPAKATPRRAKAASRRPKAASPPAGAPAGAPAPAGTGRRPAALRVAAAVQAAEAAGMAAAAAFSAYSTVQGRSYQQASGVALTLIALGTAALFALFAVGLARAKPWSRTPVVMTQLFVIIAGVTLLDGHRPEWGVPALLLATACLVALFTPEAVRALNRPPRA